LVADIVLRLCPPPSPRRLALHIPTCAAMAAGPATTLSVLLTKLLILAACLHAPSVCGHEAASTCCSTTAAVLPTRVDGENEKKVNAWTPDASNALLGKPATRVYPEEPRRSAVRLDTTSTKRDFTYHPSVLDVERLQHGVQYFLQPVERVAAGSSSCSHRKCDWLAEPPMPLTAHKSRAVLLHPKSQSKSCSVTCPNGVPDEAPNGLDEIGRDSLVADLTRGATPWLAKILLALGE